MSQVHSAAQQGFTSEAQTYARGRPEYPAEVLQWLTGPLDVNAGKTVVDLGAGTGKFTKLLAQTGADLIAVEPVDAMRAQMAQSMPSVKSYAGTGESMPLNTGAADAVVCAQAFHWFATDASLAEIHRVLKPGGQLGLIWNVRDESTDWVKTLTDIVTPYEGDAPRFYKGDWRKPFASTQLFSPLELTTFTYQHVGTAKEVIIDRFMSVSFIASLPQHEKANVHQLLMLLIATHPALRGKETISFPYATQAYRCTRLDPSHT